MHLHWIQARRTTRARRLLSIALLAFPFVFFAAQTTLAQAVYGAITGTVVDRSGAVVPNATVTVTDVGKGQNYTLTSNEQGQFTAQHLIPDIYRVKAEAAGFAPAQTEDIQLYADTTPNVQLTLQTGTATATVEVSGAAPILQTERADVSTILNERALENLPNFNRNFTAFELLTPGTSFIGWGVGETNNPQRSQQIELNGQLPFATGYELDGTDNQEPVNGVAVINPNLDAVSEMKVTSQDYDAELGKGVAGIVTAQTKSGSNAFHGSAFWFRRTDATQARDPFQQAVADPITGRFIPANTHNQFGGSVGGPIKRDRLFAFGDYQGQRERTGSSTRLTVPTAKAHNTCTSGGICDLSDYPQQIFDPDSNPIAPQTRTPFMGNMIPGPRLSTPAVNLLKLLPLPNAGAPTDTTNNYVASGSGRFHTDQWDIRVDDQTTQKLRVFGRITRFTSTFDGAPYFGAGGGGGFANGFAGNAATTDYSLASGGDYTLSSKWLTDFRFGWYEISQNIAGPNGNQPLGNQLGIPNTNVGDLTLNGGLPLFEIEFPSAGTQNFGTTANQQLFKRDAFQWVNNWTHVIRTHTVKFGGDVRYAFNHNVGVNNNYLRSGQYAFRAAVTSDGPKLVPSGIGGTSAGNGVASFLLGDVSNFFRTQTFNTSAAERQKLLFVYAQDSWRVTQTLTLNYGLRWEQYFPETVNGKGNGGFTDLNAGVVRICGIGPWGTNCGQNKNWTTFAPRVGLAWQVHPTTVIRSGYGRVYGQGWSGNTVGGVLTNSFPIQYTQNTQGTDFYRTFLLDNGPPAAVAPVIPTDGSYVLPDGILESVRPLTVRLPTVDAWNLAVQQQLTKTMSLTVQYVGSHSIHNMFDSSNQFSPNQPTVAGVGQINPATGVQYTRAERQPFYDGTAQKQLGVPYGIPHGWTQDFRYNNNQAGASYNALQALFSKQFSHGLQFLSHYTWSRSLTHESNYFLIAPRVNYSPSYYNKNNAFVLTGNYDLPFGRGRDFVSNVPGWANQIIGGFAINGSLTKTGGYPFTPQYQNCNVDTPEAICHLFKAGTRPHLEARSFDPIARKVKYFDVSPTVLLPGQTFGSFTRASQPGVFGDWGRNSLIGPGFTNVDFSVAKNFPIREQLRLQFRAEAFNVLNHVNLANPDSCVDCLAAGDSNAGYINQIVSSQDGTSMRRLQFALRVDF